MAKLPQANSMKRQPDAVNMAGGAAFAIKNPATALISLVGGSFFNEDTYYDKKKMKPGDDFPLTKQGRDLVARARALALSEPQTLASIANWLRNEANIRTTSVLLFGILASNAADTAENAELIRTYGPKVLKRPDELPQAWNAYALFHPSFKPGQRVTVRRAFGSALGSALQAFDLYQLLKWDKSTARPSLGTLLKVIPRKKDFPLTQSVAKYLQTGEVSEDAPALVKSRAALMALAKTKGYQLTEKDWPLIKAARPTLEDLTSNFGAVYSTYEAILLADDKLMPAMTALFQLRNFEKANVSPGTKAYTALVKRLDAVDWSKVMPHRFFTASGMVETGEYKALVSSLTDKITGGMDMPEGLTVVAVDGSGSMTSTKISAKSTATIIDVACTLAAYAVKAAWAKHKVALPVIMWAESAKVVNLDPNSTVPDMVTKLKSVDVGHATYVDRAAQAFMEIKPEVRALVRRFVLLSDMQAYDKGYSTKGPGSPIERLNMPFYSVHMGGTTATEVKSSSKVVTMSGMNEAIFKQMCAIEGMGVTGPDGETTEATKSNVNPDALLDYIRANF